MPDAIGDRMKHNYEDSYKIRLPYRMPVILRLDGKSFHTFTRHMAKPFDHFLMISMVQASYTLCKNIQGAKLAYVQSDEISILINNYTKLDTCAWFDNELQKMVSISASIASVEMSRRFDKNVYFDSRAFVLPEAEVANYFIWRQQDATRNSQQMLARSLYSHKELLNKNTKQLMDMCWAKGKNWNDLRTIEKRGSCIVREDGEFDVDYDIPIFTQEREYIERFLVTEE